MELYELVYQTQKDELRLALLFSIAHALKWESGWGWDLQHSCCALGPAFARAAGSSTAHLGRIHVMDNQGQDPSSGQVHLVLRNFPASRWLCWLQTSHYVKVRNYAKMKQSYSAVLLNGFQTLPIQENQRSFCNNNTHFTFQLWQKGRLSAGEVRMPVWYKQAHVFSIWAKDDKCLKRDIYIK